MGVFQECSSCSKIVKTRKGIIRHIKRRECLWQQDNEHSVRRLRCSHCERHFRSKSGRLYHMKKVHDVVRESTVKSKKCIHCSAVFATESGRFKHVRKHHPSVASSSAKKLYECFHCHKSFTTKPYRLKHENACLLKTKFSDSISGSNKREAHRNVLRSFTSEESRIPIRNITNAISLTSTVTGAISEMANSETNNTLRSDPALFDEVIVIPSLEVTSTSTLPTSNVGDVAHEITSSETSSIWNVFESGESANVTPSLQYYLRVRKPFMQLGTPDVQTPRRSRISLRHGKETITAYRKKIDMLQQQVRRLKKQVEAYKELIHHLKEEQLISIANADHFLVRLTPSH